MRENTSSASESKGKDFKSKKKCRKGDWAGAVVERGRATTPNTGMLLAKGIAQSQREGLRAPGRRNETKL